MATTPGASGSDCSRVVLRNVIARNYNGDGLERQVCHEVKVEGCQSVDNTGLGMHPGSGSQRTVIETTYSSATTSVFSFVGAFNMGGRKEHDP